MGDVARTDEQSPETERNRSAMLIPSPRHQPDDLALWREYEEADRIHGERLLASGKVERSVAAIVEFVLRGSCYVGVSGGKDSACTVALLDSAGVLASVPAIHFRAVPKQNPDVPRSLDALCERFPDLRLSTVDYLSPVPSVGVTREQAESVAGRNFHDACERVSATWGRRIIGVRADESGVRRISLRRWGLASANSCRPLGWWTLQDVYGYAAVRDVPLHPSYAMLGNGRWDRKSLRVDALFGANGDQFGRAEWEAEYYGDILRRQQVDTITPMNRSTYAIFGGALDTFVSIVNALSQRGLLWCCFSDKLGDWVICTDEDVSLDDVRAAVIEGCRANPRLMSELHLFDESDGGMANIIDIVDWGDELRVFLPDVLKIGGKPETETPVATITKADLTG